jgi:signal transduction histidine kinase
MRGLTAHRAHAFRVAAVATLFVMVCYVIAAVVLNLLVTHHLVGNVDRRLSDRLEDVRHQTLQLPEGASRESVDVDDAPLFLWSISPNGTVTSLTPGGPTLPAHAWSAGPVTLPAGGSTFRFDSIRDGDTTLVAGQSVASTNNTKSTLFVAELVFGVLLALAVFIGATIVGLRASAPSELVRRRQAEFTADASHELRTPIAVIEAEVELALHRPRDPVAYREALERVGQESSRLRRIVEDLLWLARADDQTMRSQATDLADVADVAEACGQRFQALAATNRVELAVARVGTGPFTVLAPPTLIDRLIGVLVDNACKFAGEDGRVEVTVRSSGHRVELRVEDSGPGIPEEQRDAVFDRFHRADESVAGTGLGLAIADSVVRATQGSWDIGTAELGGARMAISWRRVTPKKGRPSPDGTETLSKSLA